MKFVANTVREQQQHKVYVRTPNMKKTHYHATIDDPDSGPSLKKEFLEGILNQEADYVAGRIQSKPLEQVERELGLDDDGEQADEATNP